MNYLFRLKTLPVPIREKNLKKNIYICVTESLCCTPETNNIVNQLYFNKK